MLDKAVAIPLLWMHTLSVCSFPVAYPLLDNLCAVKESMNLRERFSNSNELMLQINVVGRCRQAGMQPSKPSSPPMAKASQ